MINSPRYTFSPSLCQNEREVESKFIVSYLLPELGYDIDMWHQEVRQNRFRLDFLAYSQQGRRAVPEIIIEVKHPQKNLRHSQYQLKNYMRQLQVNYGLLTNGHSLIIYQRGEHNQVDIVFECNIDNITNHIEKIRSIIGKNQITNTNIQAITSASEPHEMKILAIFHNKGGVGKTTVTVNLADAIARTGKKVLIVDIDSQANATFATGLMNFSDELADDIKSKYIYHLLQSPQKFSIGEVARKARYSPQQDIDVIPSHILLMKEEKGLNELSFINRILLTKLEKSNKRYDVVVIDTPPSLNLYARIGLISSEYLLIPSDLKVFANEGLENVKTLIEEINATKEIFGLPSINILGILPSKILNNPRYLENLRTQRIPRIEATYGFSVLKDHMITERVDLARCFDEHVEVGNLDIPDPKSIFEYNPSSPAVGEFENLAAYVMQQMGLSK